jgi:C-terminal binding-module, SLH-like, of glucodextranase/Alpha amylase, catalytic domain
MWRSICAKKAVAATAFCGSVALASYAVANNQSGLPLPSPDWRDQIIYSLMIERFEDGDQSNNDKGFSEYNPVNDAYFNGGDIKGIIRRVPYLKALGVTATWVSPPTATQWWNTDPAGDDRGPEGKYQRLTDAPGHKAADIHAVDIRANDEELELSIEVGEIKNVWNYINKVDHASFSIYIDSDDLNGVKALPGLAYDMPKDARWDFSHRLFGMGSAIHLATGANSEDFGMPLAGQPFIKIDAGRRRFTIRYSRTALGIKSWDSDEFGRYRKLGTEASAKQLGGSNASDPHRLDDIFISLAGEAPQ